MGGFRKHIQTWTKLSGEGRKAFLSATFSLIWIKVGLSVLPFSTFRRVFGWISASKKSNDIPKKQIDLTVWAVDTAANLLPFELLCLPRALATKYLLREAPALTLEIGIEVNPAKAFEAHAWVEKNGHIIIGEWPKTVTYQRLWVWQ